jgi:hypothetical protein
MRHRSSVIELVLIVAASAAVIGTAVRWRLAQDLETRTSPPVLRDLHGADEFRAQFNTDRGKTRLVLLLSPT